MADEEEFGAMMAENLTLKEVVSEQNETLAQLREQMTTLNERLASFSVAGEDTTQTALNLADTKQALVERNELLKSWLQTAQTWESMFSMLEQENSRLRAALKAFTN